VSDDRTEHPTHRKLDQARRRGQIARSRDVHDVFQLAAALVAFSWFGRYAVEGLGHYVARNLEAIGHNASRTVTAGEITGLALETGTALLVLVGPISFAAMIGGVAAIGLQGGWVLSWEPLKFNIGKLSPMAGFSRLAPSRAGVDLLRTSLILSALAWQTIGIVRDFVHQAPTFGRIAPAHSGALAWTTAELLLKRALIVFGTVAAADYYWQKFRFIKSQKMTKQEVKDEMKLSEGNPQIKGRIRKMQREILRKRMLAAVPKATVVITNPTHIAVALEYQRDKMFAPLVTAIGADLMAERIKAIAREHQVPIVENVALARALHANAEVGDVIPGDLFEAVAEVLAYLIRLKQLVI
jgi:flagellar biosynthesis protein FlhB